MEAGTKLYDTSTVDGACAHLCDDLDLTTREKTLLNRIVNVNGDAEMLKEMILECRTDVQARMFVILDMASKNGHK